jgi:hypothetical protein
MRIPKGLIEETKAMIRLYLFLRHECGLREADRLSARELRELFFALNSKKKCLNDNLKVL